jgi:CheY-like chemotaxis protein
VVDDDPLFRRSITELLAAEGFSVEQAENGKQALVHIQERVPDLMLLDLAMPEMDGFEVLQRLRTDPKAVNLPVLVITGKTLTGDERHYIRRRLATLVGKRDADLAYFTKIVGKALGKELQRKTAPEGQLQQIAG